MSRRVLITGASSGLGRALAVHFARSRNSLILTGRNTDRLLAVSKECEAIGANVTSKIIDVCHRGELANWLAEVEQDRPIDIVIANAGLMSGTPPLGTLEPSEVGYALVATNVLGVLNTVQPLLEPMIKRRRGHIAIVSSLAAFVPLPDSPSYCASKSAVLSYGLALRTLLRPHGVKVSVICPGYVSTPMSARENAIKRQLISSEKAAAIIANGIRRNAAVISFPRTLAAAARLHGILPDPIRSWLMRWARFTVSD
jgi:short-subunit dehydrogenase